MEKKGIKEIMDVLNAVEAGVDQVKVALADGKVSTVELLTMAMAMVSPLKDALEGLQAVVSEIKDVDQDEAAALAAKAYAIAAKVMGLKKA